MNKIFHLLLALLTTAAFIACPPPEECVWGANEVKPSGISVSANSTVVPINGTLLVSAAVEPATVDQSVTWISSDSEIATVDAYGWVTGVKTGAVTITAASVVDPSVTGSITLTCESTAFETVWEFDGTDFILRLKGIKTYIENLEAEVKPTKLTGYYTTDSGTTNQFGGSGISDDYAIRFPKDAQSGSVSFKFETEDGTDITESVTSEFPDLSKIRFAKGEVTITPAYVNILRKTDEKGEPSAKAMVAFSLPDMEVLMNETWFADEPLISSRYDFSNASWSGVINAGGTSVEIPAQTAYAKIYEFDLATGADQECSVTGAEIFVPGTSPDFVGLLTTQWGSDILFGNTITVKGSREYPAEIWLDDAGNYSETAVEGYTKYVLSWGDDFNYPFNGLNYKNNDAYLAARETPGDPASNFARLWGCENLEKGSHGRKSGTWDFRTIEAKNGMLMSKHMAADADNDIFYLGLNKTKPLGGFTDINQDGQSGHTFVPNFISGAAVTNELYGKGYYVAKLRTRYKGYSDTKHFTGGEAGGTGAWFAFWMHGPVHEFDLMEQTAGSPRVINYVNQYHNSWGTYGTTYMSYFYQQLNVNGADTVMQDKWYKLALQWTDDQVTYYYNDVWAHYYRATDNNNKQATLTKNNNLQSQADAESINGNSNTSVNTSGFTTKYREYGYTDTLLAVPQAPMNVFLSTEIGSGWGSVPTQENALNHLPVWVEADYIAYYVPEGSAEAAN